MCKYHVDEYRHDSEFCIVCTRFLFTDMSIGEGETVCEHCLNWYCEKCMEKYSIEMERDGIVKQKTCLICNLG